MSNEIRFTKIALVLLVVSIIGLFIGVSDATLGTFDFDLGFYFFGEFDNEYDVIAWLILLGSFPAFLFNIIVIYNIDLLFKKTNLGSGTFVNLLLIFFVPFYQLFYIYKRLDYLSTLNHSLGDKKFFYTLLAFIGLNTFALALTHDEVIASSAFRSSGDFVIEDKKVYGDSVGQFDGSVTEELTRLKKLLDDEVISKDEFNTLKDKLLSR
jgi:hypothetical protein